MVESAANGLVQLGLKPGQIRTERFGPAGGYSLEETVADMNRMLMVDGNAVGGLLQEYFRDGDDRRPRRMRELRQRGGDRHAAGLHPSAGPLSCAARPAKK